MKKIMLLCLFLFPLLLQAQESSPPILRLTKDSLRKSLLLADKWKFHAGDDTAWASLSFNDHSWTAVNTYLNVALGSEKEVGFKGRGWFRAHFITDSTLAYYPIALEMQQSGASE